ncbi:unnamed protein product, partial [Meganyctiphanes norvegica]
VTFQEMLQGSADDLQVLQSSSAVKRSAEPEEFPVLQSLSGDTAVNFLEPRPSVNPDAEVVAQDEPHIVLVNQATSGHHKPQVPYQKSHFVYKNTHVYHNQTTYHRPKRVEVYIRPHHPPTRTRPKL